MSEPTTPTGSTDPPHTAGPTGSPLPDASGSLVVDDRRTWSAGEVWDLADRIAHLARAACPAGRRFAVFAENAGEAVIAHLDGLRSGVSVVAASSHLNGADASYLFEVGDVALVVAGPRTAGAAREAATRTETATGRG